MRRKERECWNENLEIHANEMKELFVGICQIENGEQMICIRESGGCKKNCEGG